MVDQTTPLSGGKHVRAMGTVDFKANADTVIQITYTDTAGLVILDAPQLQPVKPELKSNE